MQHNEIQLNHHLKRTLTLTLSKYECMLPLNAYRTFAFTHMKSANSQAVDRISSTSGS